MEKQWVEGKCFVCNCAVQNTIRELFYLKFMSVKLHSGHMRNRISL